MIASRLGLAIVGAIAIVLAAITLLAGGRTNPNPDRTLMPGFAPDEVTELGWTDAKRPAAVLPSRPPEGDVTIKRDPESPTGWSWRDPPGSGDARTIEHVLAALRGARWHRRVPVDDGRGPWTTQLAIAQGSTHASIAIGAPVPDAEQWWIAIGPHAYLVDAWVARALTPGRLALRHRNPLGTADGDTWSYATPDRTVELAGSRITAPAPLLLDPAVVAALERAHEQLAVTALPAGPLAGERGLAIATSKLRVVEAGPCPGHPDKIAIDGTHGAGCVERAAWDAIAAAVAALAKPPAEIVERRPIPFEPTRIELADGATLDLEKRPRIGDRDADPTRVAELLAALAAPADVVSSTAAPSGKLTITGRDGVPIILELLPGNLMRRHGEPVALRPGAGAYAILARPGSALADPTLWNEEPTTIRALTVGPTTYTRGAVIGEWTRSGPGPDAPATVEQLARSLASLRALDGKVTTRPRTRVTLEIAAPGKPPATRVLELGDRVPGGCAAIVDGRHVLVAADLCALAAKLAPP